MKIYVVEYFGGEYSDSWSVIKGVFSTHEKAMEWVRANPNDERSYGSLSEEDFTLYEFEIDNPDYVEPPEQNAARQEFFYQPFLRVGAMARVTGYAPNAGPKRVALLHQIGTVTRRDYRNVELKFGDAKQKWDFSLEYVEAVVKPEGCGR